MRKIILSISIISILVVSCKEKESSHTPLSKLLEDKTVLQKQIDSLNVKLKEIEKSISEQDTTKRIQKVTSMQVQDTLFNHYIDIQGTVASDQNVVLNPEMGGTISNILVKEGQRVSAGQTLVQFDDQSLRDQANVLQTQLDLAKTTFERQERLWHQKIGSEMQYLQAKAQKEGLEKNLASIHTQMGKMKLRAPYGGVVDEIYAKKGEMTGMQSSILRLINLNKMYVEAEVPETYLKSIKKGTPVILEFIAIDKEIKAQISEVSNFINPDNRSFKIRINLNNVSKILKPNLLANLKINDFSSKGIVIPKGLIQMNQAGEQFVYSIVQDSLSTQVVKKIIETGLEYNNQVIINKGLSKEDVLVKEGGKFLKDGDKVIVE